MLRHWLLFVLLFSALIVAPVAAQEGDTTTLVPYENPDFGITMQIPADWIVETTADKLLAGSIADLEATKNFTPPGGLVLTINLGTFNTMGVQSANQLATEIVNFAPSGVNPQPQNIIVADATGFMIEFEIPDSTLHTKVALLSITGARLAVIRGYAPLNVWTASAGATFEQILQSIEFDLPSTMANPLENLPDSDGGVLWQYQSGQPEGAPTVILGGMTFDDFGVMYVAAGPRGILAMNKGDGSFVNYLLPNSSDTNLTDVVIGPQDALLYFSNAGVADDRILVTDRVGNPVRSWGTEGDDAGEFAPGMPRSIAITRDNNVWVISEGHSTEPRERLYRFDRYGTLLATIDLAEVNPDLRAIRIDNDINTGGMFLVGAEGGLNLLDSDGSLLVPNIAKDLLTTAVPTDIAISADGLIIIATQNEGFLQFTQIGEIVDRFGFPYDTARGGAFQPGEYIYPNGLVIDRDGVIYYSETNRDTRFSQVQAFRFSGDGNLPLPGRPTVDVENPSVVTSSGGQIAYGGVVRGLIDNRSPQHDYTFSAVAGDTITITMKDVSTQGTLDPTIVLLDINGNEVARNDDVPAATDELKATDAELIFTVGSDGTYIIRATRFGGNGEYELSLTEN